MRSVGISKTRAPLYTDSETSIISSKNKKLNTLHYILSNDTGVALQLQQTINNNSEYTSLFHVQGHQDKNKNFQELDIPAQMNVLMDSLSKQLVKETMYMPNRSIPFPAQEIYISTDQPRELILKIDWEASRLAI